MSSYLDFEGKYDMAKRYIVNNWSNEDFAQSFGSEVTYNGDKMIESVPARQIIIKAGEMRELGQFEAYTFTKHFVNREMFKAATLLSDRVLVERAEMGVNNKELRKPYEDKTISEIEAGKTTPFMEKIREEIRQEELAKINKPKAKEDELVDPLKDIVEEKEEKEVKTSEFSE